MKGASFFLGDLNEYIAPGAVCIVPEAKNVALSLKDCLACSGCVTTAETMLVAQQTHRVVRQAVSEGRRVWCILSPTSTTALAVALGTDPENAQRAAAAYARLFLRAEAVLDCAVAERLALRCASAEFAERLRTSSLPVIASECPGWVCYAEKRQAALLPQISRVRSPQQICGALAREVLGGRDAFVFAVMPCYDKKLEASRSAHFGTDIDTVITTGEFLEMMREDAGERTVSEFTRSLFSPDSAPELGREASDKQPSTAPLSPAYLALGVVRNKEDAAGGYLLSALNTAIAQLAPGSRMLSRADLSDAGNSWTLCELPRISCTKCRHGDRAPGMSAPSRLPDAGHCDTVGTEGSGASPTGNGTPCADCRGAEDAPSVSVRRVRGRDYVDYVLSVPGTADSLCFSRVYGFRNIQTYLQRSRRLRHAYVEAMACPSACLLGGGQPAVPADALPGDHRAHMEATHASPRAPCHGDAEDEADRLYGLIGADTRLAQRVVYTSYEAVSTEPAHALHVQW